MTGVTAPLLLVALCLGGTQGVPWWPFSLQSGQAPQQRSICPPTPTCSFAERGMSKPYPPDCTRYVYCNSLGDWSLRVCLVGKHFGPTLGYCAAPDEANCPLCDISTTTTTTTTLVPEPAPICPEQQSCTPEDYGFLIAFPTDCRLYVYCDYDGTQEISTCPEGKHFSAALQDCVSPEEARCPHCIGLCGPYPTCSPDEVGLTKAIPMNCSSYAYCTAGGNIQERKCLAGQHYSPYLNRCMSIANARCLECIPIETTIPTTAPSTPTTIGSCTLLTCTEEDLGSDLPYTPDCTKYIYCDEVGRNTPNSVCPVGKHFSPAEGRCMLIEEAACPQCVEITTVPTTIPPCEATPTCSASDVGEVKPYPPDCRKYLYCDEEGPGILRLCKPPLQFSPEQLFCMPEEDANCPSCEPLTTTPEITTSTTESTSTTTESTSTSTESTSTTEVTSTTEQTTTTTEQTTTTTEQTTTSDQTSTTEPTTTELTTITTTTELTSTTGLTSTTTESTSTNPPPTTIPICPPIEPCTLEEVWTNKPYYPNCSRYIYCHAEGPGILRNCRSGYQFSHSLLFCTPAAEADCPYCVLPPITTERFSTTPQITPPITTERFSTTPQTTLPPTTTVPVCPPTPECDPVWDLYVNKPYPPDCTKYIYCDDGGVPVITPCPPGKEYNDARERCELPEIAQCPYCQVLTTTEMTTPLSTTERHPETSPTTTIETTTPTTTPEITTPTTTLEITTPTTTPEITTPTTTPEITTTTTPEITTPTTTPEITTPTTTLEITTSTTTSETSPESTTPVITTTLPYCAAIPSCEPGYIGNIPYPPDCTRYSHCEDGVEEPSFCPPGLHFDPYSENCLAPELASCPACIETTVATTPTTTPTEPTTLPYCAAIPSCEPGFIGTIPYPPDCTMYIYCEEGVEELSNCTPGLHYDLNTGNCKEPELANCPTCIETTVDTSPPTETTTLPYCPEVETCAPGQFGTLPFPPDCTRYVYCEDGTTQLSKCPAGKEFSVERGVCLDPAIANCPRCIYTTVTEPSTTTLPPEPTLPPCPPQETCEGKPTGAQLPVYTDCSLYIYCDTGVPYESICFGDDVFNPNIGGPGDGACFPPSEFTCPYCTVVEEGKPVEQKKKSLFWFLF